MNAQSYIVQSTDNSGSYDWTPSTSLTATDDTNKYGIELICDQTQAYQYTTRFSLDNSNPTSSSASGSASGSTTASGSASSSASVSSSTTSVKYPTGNSTTTAVTGGVTSTGTATVTHTASGSKTTGGATSTGSSTSSSGSASATGNAADHMKAGFDGVRCDKQKFEQDVKQSLSRYDEPNDGDVAGCDSTLSSPLSSPEEDMDLMSPPPFSLSASWLDSRSNVVSLGPSDLVYQPNSDMVAPIRSFRTRTAIQLHPYVLEKEKHNRMFRAAGYKPMHLAGSQELGHSQTVPNVAEDSQTQSLLQSSQVAYDSSQASESQSQIDNVIEPVAVLDDSDADLPDVEAFLRQAKPGRLPKRRKLLHVAALTPLRRLLPDMDEVEHIPTVASEPPTPPTSRSGTSSVAQDEANKPRTFRLPRTNARGMLTPKASSPVVNDSLHRNSARDQVVTASSQEQDRLSTSGASDAESASVASSDSEDQFRSARKRIRGVLPASWLRFDGKARKDGKNRQATGIHPGTGNTSTAKGIAQRRILTNATPEIRSNHFDGFSEDSDNERPASPPIKAVSPKNGVLASSDIEFDSDRMEDNAIDTMIPAAVRKPRRLSKKPKKQGKHGNDFRLPTSASTVNQSRRSESRKRGAKERVDRQKGIYDRRRIEQPFLSVVDLLSPFTESTMLTPPFLRIAKRQARKQHNYGRHSPRQKVIRLPTRLDTEDAMSTLTAWRAGRILQRDLPSMRRDGTGKSQSILSQLLHEGNKKNKDHEKSTLARDTTRLARLPAIAGRQPRINSHFQAPIQSSEANEEQADLVKEKQDVLRQSRVLLARKHKLQNSTRPRAQYRPANLEAVDHRPRLQRLPGAASLHTANLLKRSEGLKKVPQELNFQLQRFLDYRDTLEKDERSLERTEHGQEDTFSQPSRTAQNSGRSRKSAPRRLSTEIADYRQPEFPIPLDNSDFYRHEEAFAADVSGLRGLDAFNGQCAIDFDVRHLDRGTFFHSSTFLGSGDFAKVLALKKRDLNDPAGHITIRIDDQDTRWSAWSEETSTWLGAICGICEDAFQLATTCADAAPHLLDGPMSTSIYLLRSLVRYFSSCLRFSDPVDRRPCLMRLRRFLEDMAEALTLNLHRPIMDTNMTLKKQFVDCAIYFCCLCYQHVIISGRDAQDAAANGSIVRLLRQICFLVTEKLFKNGCQALRSFAETFRHHSIRDSGAKDDEVAVKFVVVMNEMLEELGSKDLSIDAFLSALWRDQILATSAVKELDWIWYDVLSIQPVCGFQADGLYRPRLTATQKGVCWTVVKLLLERTFQLYNATGENYNTAAVAYIRAVFSRVDLLFTKWQWAGPDAVLATIYDFFAKRGLSHLTEERMMKGSSSFLIHLDADPNLDIGSADEAYYAFLKVLAKGLKAIGRYYTVNKLKRIAWRFVPNHGRTYRKDQDVRRADLDALRNHHDLLCILYWALPAGSRPRLNHIADLVDFSTSHQEACRINIDAWRNLAVCITAHHNEKPELISLASWFRDFCSAIISQHRLARSEAEELFEMSKDRSSGALSFDIMQMTVTGNQRRILDTLYVALLAMKDALKSCGDRRTKLDLVEQSGLVGALKIFDVAQSRTFAPVLHVLQIIKELITPDNKSHQAAAQSSDSQDYGDWDGLEELVDGRVQDTKSDEVDTFLPAIHQLLSNCFGADGMVDDSLLAVLVDVWCGLAARTVERGSKSWSHYLDVHGGDSWFQLRHTDQFVKFTPYMLAQFLIIDRRSFFEHEDVFLGVWLVALVEREANLKFQHQLTSALLNAETHCSLLHDLPFELDSRLDAFNIALFELRSRRTSLIGCILANMRTALDATRSDTAALRREYSPMLRQMMQAMKEGYQSLTTSMSSSIADPAAKGAHVSFLQQTVSLMQQYTSEICQIDTFFTDSAVFPLPTSDPQYIIGRLKSYTPKLRDDRGQKQLAMLMQTLLSNACSSGDQTTLRGQLAAALLPTADGDPGQNDRALRRIIFHDILPAYCALVPTTSGAALLISPVMHAACIVIDELRFHVNFASARPSQTEVEGIDAALSGVESAVLKLLSRPRDLISIEHMGFLAAAFNATAKTLSTLSFAARSCPDVSMLLTLMRLYDLAQRGVPGIELAVEYDRVSENRNGKPRSVLAEYAVAHLRELLAKEWRWDGRVFVNASGQLYESVDALLSTGREEGLSKIGSAMSDFCSAWETIVEGRQRDGVLDALQDVML
ncbi:hypothetical protein ANO11243_032040 [Dothideomycetidae sp. 11243]|nr:hypothetical protein ANO11243_032040 [fungal sp. No.11243]